MEIVEKRLTSVSDLVGGEKEGIVELEKKTTTAKPNAFERVGKKFGWQVSEALGWGR